MLTIEEWIHHCRDALESAGVSFGHGTDNAGDEAAWLVLHALGRAVDGTGTAADETVGPAQAEAIRALLRRRIDERVPMAYLAGRAWFAGLEFEVGAGVLVPRSPIAELVAERFEPWVNPERVERVLDLCTGSGCIGIAAAEAFPAARVDLADLSDAALAYARRNVARHGLAGRVEVIRSDLFAALAGRRYDLVVSNPPYVPRGEFDTLPTEYRAEPAMGLVSGEDGLDLPLRILAGAGAHLAADGVLVCEVGESRDALEAALPRVPFLWPELAGGGMGVFVLDRQQLETAAPEIRAALEQR